MRLILLVLIVALSSTSTTVAQSRLLLPDGSSQTATLKSVTSDGKWLFSADKERLLASENLLAWGQIQDPNTGPFLILTDGSLLVGQPVQVTADKITLRSLLWGELNVTRSRVQGMVWQWPTKASERDELMTAIKSFSERSDRVLLRGGDVLNGRIRGKLVADKLAFEVELGGDAQAELPISRIAAVLFRPPLVGPADDKASRVWLSLRSGDVLSVAETSIVDGLVTTTLTCGEKLRVDAVSYVEEIVGIFPELEGTTHLSKLKPIAFVHKPFLTTPWQFGVDRSTTGGRLRHDGKLYQRGIGLHSLSQIAFAFDTEYKRFVAELALDDSVELKGSVVYRLYVDKGTGKFEPVWQSEIVRGGDQAIVVSQDLTDVKRISLVVSYADNADVMDRANWLGCWLVK